MTCKSARASWDLGTLTLLCFQTATEKGTGKGDGSQGIRWTNYIPVGGLLPRAYLTLVAKLALRPSLGGGGTYPREGKPRRGFLCPLNFLGAIPEGARKSLALFGILGVETRRTKIAS